MTYSYWALAFSEKGYCPHPAPVLASSRPQPSAQKCGEV